jgi:hypothetical protein
MTAVYFDSSAFVKLFVPEVGSALVAELWDGCDLAVSSRLAYPEVTAALAAAGRRSRAAASRSGRAIDEWASVWSDVRPVELTRSVEHAAGDCARRFDLSGADAVHLASALALGDPSVVMATYDRRLSGAALAAGLRVVPATI